MNIFRNITIFTYQSMYYGIVNVPVKFILIKKCEMALTFRIFFTESCKMEQKF